MKLCKEQRIEQKFTKVRNPKSNGKAEHVIRTIMEMSHDKTKFKSSAHRKTELKRSLDPLGKLIGYFFPIFL